MSVCMLGRFLQDLAKMVNGEDRPRAQKPASSIRRAKSDDNPFAPFPPHPPRNRWPWQFKRIDELVAAHEQNKEHGDLSMHR